MSLLRECIAIFKRNPYATTIGVVLIAAASIGQVVSLGSLYPILETLISTDGNLASDGIFVRILGHIGVEPTLSHLLTLFIALGISYCILSWLADTFQGIHLRNFEVAVRRELFETVINAEWLYARGIRHGEFLNVITKEANNYK